MGVSVMEWTQITALAIIGFVFLTLALWPVVDRRKD